MEKEILALLTQIQSDLSELKQQSRSTDWVRPATLCQQLGQRGRWAEVWRNAGLFSIDGGHVRNVGTDKAPRYEYHLDLCIKQWEWWSALPSSGKKAFKDGAKAA